MRNWIGTLLSFRTFGFRLPSTEQRPSWCARDRRRWICFSNFRSFARGRPTTVAADQWVSNLALVSHLTAPRLENTFLRIAAFLNLWDCWMKILKNKSVTFCRINLYMHLNKQNVISNFIRNQDLYNIIVYFIYLLILTNNFQNFEIAFESLSLSLAPYWLTELSVSRYRSRSKWDSSLMPASNAEPKRTILQLGSWQSIECRYVPLQACTRAARLASLI